MEFQTHSEKAFRNKITYFSFVLSFFVIGIHTYNVSVYGLSERNDPLSKVVIYVEDYVRNISNICVPFFFIISGYLFFRTFEWKKLLDKYRSRLFTVAVPYFLWCCIYYLYYCTISRIPSVGGYINNGMPIEVSIPMWIEWLWTQSYYTLWFMKELIILIVASPIIYIISKNYKYFPVGVLTLAAALLCALGVIGNKIYSFNVYYLLGAYIGINGKDVPIIKNSGLTVLSRIILSGVLCYYLWNVHTEISDNVLVVILLCITFWWSFDGVSYETSPKWWMGISFFIYCAHDIFLEGLEKIFLLVFGKKSIWALLDYIFMPVIVMLICIFCATILRSYLPLMWKVLTGGRKGE